MYVTRNRCPMCTSFVGKRTTLSAYIYLARLITDGVKPHTTRHNDRKRNLDSSPATRINTTRLEGSTSKSQTPASHTSLIKSIPPRKFHLWPESRYSLFTHHSTTPPAQSHYRPDKKNRAQDLIEVPQNRSVLSTPPGSPDPDQVYCVRSVDIIGTG